MSPYIPQLIIIYEIWLQPTSRRFFRELDEAPGGNNLHYILQCLCIPASITRVWTRKVCWVVTECSRNDGSKTQYYIVILDQLQGCSRGLEWAPESRIRGPLASTPPRSILLSMFCPPQLALPSIPLRSPPSASSRGIPMDIDAVWKMCSLPL